jgi:hypothetical protein
MNLFGIGANPIIDIILDGADSRKNMTVKEKGGSPVKIPLFLVILFTY